MSNTSRFGITIQVLPSEKILEYFIGEYFNSLLITIVVVVFFSIFILYIIEKCIFIIVIFCVAVVEISFDKVVGL